MNTHTATGTTFESTQRDAEIAADLALDALFIDSAPF
jgi:hypothetical protein